MSTYNRLDLQALGSQPIMPKNLPDHRLVAKSRNKSMSLHIAVKVDRPLCLDPTPSPYLRLEIPSLCILTSHASNISSHIPLSTLYWHCLQGSDQVLVQCYDEFGKLSSKVMMMFSSYMGTFNYVSYSTSALTLLTWSNKSPPSCILYVKNLQQMKRITNDLMYFRM